MNELTQLAQTLIGPAAIAPITDKAFLRITGPDATRWLNGMVTNNIKDLAPGHGNYNFLLNAQGRIQADCTIYREPTDGPATFLLETDNSQLETVHQTLDRFIIMDDVELTEGVNVVGTRVDKSSYGLALIGTQAAEILLKTIVARDHITAFDTPPPPGTITRASLDGKEVLILTPPNVSDSYEVWSCDTKAIKELYRVWEFYNAVPISPETVESLRILSATPRYGIDIRDRDLPQETAQTHALNFNKGCYLGQEIVERIHSRGQVHRTFTQFTLSGDPPTLPAPLTATALSPDGQAKPAGELTSATRIGDQIFALGYIRREVLETRQPITYPNGTATPSK